MSKKEITIVINDDGEVHCVHFGVEEIPYKVISFDNAKDADDEDLTDIKVPGTDKPEQAFIYGGVTCESRYQEHAEFIKEHETIRSNSDGEAVASALGLKR